MADSRRFKPQYQARRTDGVLPGACLPKSFTHYLLHGPSLSRIRRPHLLGRVCISPLVVYDSSHSHYVVTLDMTLQSSGGMASAACLKMPSQISCCFSTRAPFLSRFPRVAAMASSKSLPRIYRLQACPAFLPLLASLLAPWQTPLSSSMVLRLQRSTYTKNLSPSGKPKTTHRYLPHSHHPSQHPSSFL